MDRSIAMWRATSGVLLVALILAVAGLFITALTVLLLAAAGVLFGIFLNALARGISRITPIRYGWSFALVVILLIALITAGIYRLGSQVVQQVDELANQLRSSMETLRKQMPNYEWMPALPSPSQLQEDFAQSSSLVPGALAGLQSVLWFVTGILVVFFVGLYVGSEPGMYTHGLLKLIPPRDRSRGTEVLGRLRTTLVQWMVGRLFSMTVVGVATAVALWLLGVPLAITLGGLAALLTFIPNIGPILAAVPQVLLALKVDGNTALYVLLFNIVLQTVESYLLTPIVQRYEVSLPPALTIIAQLMLGVIAGAIGVVMAAPLVVVILVLTEMLYIQDPPGANGAGGR